jgi:hypothetical protein
MKVDAKINTAGGPVTVHLVFGFACVGTYEATLYDISDKNGITLQTGASTDSSPDVVTIPDAPASLLNRTLLIDAALVPPSPPDMVSITAQAYQDGNAIPGTSLVSKASVGPGQKATPMLFFRFTS